MDKYEGPAELYAQGRLLAEAVKVSWTISGNNNRVLTMRKGLAGKSDGATVTEVSVESAVPVKGLEFDFRNAVISKKIFTVMTKSAGQRLQVQGWFEDTKWENAVDATTVISSNFVGGAPKILGG